jgi:phenylpropionate dioxygenase-like ring-hydroxylating dioxygenase large terminal subunit
MRSAYGLQIPEPDGELTRVGPGTPCGELLRRYWHPVCLSADLQDLPKRVRILGEDLVAFRDGQGRPGLMFFRCSHRGTSLEYGRVEERGLRCCYHGWLYDVEGRILETPLEPPESTFKDRLEHPCYPVQEYGGLLFAYMGPLDRMPLLPKLDIWTQPGGTLQAHLGPRVGGAVNCNWLQSQENLMDALHTQWLHTTHSGPQFPSELYGLMPEVEYEETDMGMKFTMTRKLPDGREWLVVWEMLMPMTTHLVYVDIPNTAPGAEGYEKLRSVAFCIPVDDTHQLGARIWWTPLVEQERGGQSRENLGPLNRPDKSYEYTQRFPDDKEAMEGQGEIAIHGLEHLASSDRGVIQFRNLLRRAIAAIRAGEDPKGIIRDPARAECVPTTAGSIVRLPVAATT